MVFTYQKFCDQSRGKVVGEGGKSRIAVTFKFNETTSVECSTLRDLEKVINSLFSLFVTASMFNR